MADYYVVTMTKTCAESCFYCQGVATQEEAETLYGKLMMGELGGFYGGFIAGPGLIRYREIFDTRIEIEGPYELNVVSVNGRYACFESVGSGVEAATKKEAVDKWLERANG